MNTIVKIILRAFSTGIRALDARLGSLLSGETLYLVGPTGEGKTTTLMTILYNLTREADVRGYGLFTELSDEGEDRASTESELDKKFGCALAGVEWRHYENTVAAWCSPNLTKLSGPDYASAQASIADAKAWREKHLVMAKESHPSSAQISAALDYCATNGLAFLVIDHLGLVDFSSEPEKNSFQQAERGFERLVKKARQLGVLFIVVGQMGKSANAPGAVVSIANIRGSHGNAAAAWTVLAVGSYSVQDGKETLVVPGLIRYTVVKNRIGGGMRGDGLARVSFGRVRDLYDYREQAALVQAARDGVAAPAETEEEPTPF